MSDEAARFRRVAAQFTRRVASVPNGAWSNPTPCEGWVTRDVVRHLVDWVPAFMDGFAGVQLPSPGPPVDDDPIGAWAALRDGLQSTLDDPGVATKEIDGPGGRTTVAHAIDQFITGDILVHTWDVARAIGLAEVLDAELVHRMVESMEPHDEAMRASGHYGPRVEVPADADEQARLLAFMGRDPRPPAGAHSPA